jgi:hypothetical protein
MITRWLATFWVGELVLAVVFGTPVLLAALLQPSPEVVTLFGWEVPAVCGFRNLTGMECLGCGLTRSFSYMAHGDLRTAFEMHLFGPVLFALFASQPPYRLYNVLRRRAESPLEAP